MTDMNDLYQELILDHNARPRNYGALNPCTHQAEGVNPLCGDHIVVYVLVENNVVQNIRFEGSGCAISKSSASLLTESVKGKTLDETKHLFEQFHCLLTDKSSSAETSLGKLSAFAGVKEFPMRVKCATLAWHTLKAALDKTSQTISTENNTDEH